MRAIDFLIQIAKSRFYVASSASLTFAPCRDGPADLLVQIYLSIFFSSDCTPHNIKKRSFIMFVLSTGSGAGTELKSRWRCEAAAPQLFRAGPLSGPVSLVLLFLSFFCFILTSYSSGRLLTYQRLGIDGCGCELLLTSS